MLKGLNIPIHENLNFIFAGLKSERVHTTKFHDFSAEDEMNYIPTFEFLKLVLVPYFK